MLHIVEPLEHYCLTKTNVPRNSEKQMHSHTKNLASKHRIQISSNSIYGLFLCARQYTWHHKEKNVSMGKYVLCRAGILNPSFLTSWLFRAWLQFKNIFVFVWYKMCEELFMLWNEWLFAWVGKNKSHPSIPVVTLLSVKHRKLQGYLNMVFLIKVPPFLFLGLS